MELAHPQKRACSDSRPRALEASPELATTRKRRKRGSGTNGGSHANRGRAGVALAAAGGAPGPARVARLQDRSYARGQVIRAAYSILTDGSATTTGWHGVPPPRLAQDEMLRQYESAEINALLAQFCPISYSR